MEDTDVDQQELFINGYFSSRMMSGETPDYGYPENHLPSVIDMKMPVKSGFMTARTR